MSTPARAGGRHRAPARHRTGGSAAVTAVRELGAAGWALGSRGLVKSAAAAAVVTGVGVALVLPNQGEAVALSITAAPASASVRTSALTAAGSTSRSQQRAAALTVAAPSAAVVARDAFGVGGVRAVIRPEMAALDPKLVGLIDYNTTSYLAEGKAKGLVPTAQAAYSAVRSAFGITNIGGLRPGDPLDHGSGHAIDVMITSKAQGDGVAAFVLAHAEELNIKYVIWQQRSWKPERGTWRLMADRGSPTQNHMDHVHISVH